MFGKSLTKTMNGMTKAGMLAVLGAGSAVSVAQAQEPEAVTDGPVNGPISYRTEVLAYDTDAYKGIQVTGLTDIVMEGNCQGNAAKDIDLWVYQGIWDRQRGEYVNGALILKDTDGTCSAHLQVEGDGVINVEVENQKKPFGTAYTLDMY